MNNPKVNVVVSGHRNEYHSTYKTYILRGGVPFADQVIMPDTKYVIKYDFDLGGGAFDLDFSNADTHTVAEVTYYYIPFTADGSKYTLMDDTLVFIDAEWNGLSAREIKPEKGTLFMIASITGGLHKNGYGINVVTVPENCILEFDGGSLKNGTIVGQDTFFINVGDVEIWGEGLTREGTWREKQGGGIPDKEYDPEHNSGLGRKTLELDGDSNVLTQEDFDQENTIYVITYDFDLNGETINIPEGCVLDFEGGSLNNGFLIGEVSTLNAPSDFYEKVNCMELYVQNERHLCSADISDIIDNYSVDSVYRQDAIDQVISLAHYYCIDGMDKLIFRLPQHVFDNTSGTTYPLLPYIVYIFYDRDFQYVGRSVDYAARTDRYIYNDIPENAVYVNLIMSTLGRLCRPIKDSYVLEHMYFNFLDKSRVFISNDYKGDLDTFEPTMSRKTESDILTNSYVDPNEKDYYRIGTLTMGGITRGSYFIPYSVLKNYDFIQFVGHNFETYTYNEGDVHEERQYSTGYIYFLKKTPIVLNEEIEYSDWYKHRVQCFQQQTTSLPIPPDCKCIFVYAAYNYEGSMYDCSPKKIVLRKKSTYDVGNNLIDIVKSSNRDQNIKEVKFVMWNIGSDNIGGHLKNAQSNLTPNLIAKRLAGFSTFFQKYADYNILINEYARWLNVPDNDITKYIQSLPGNITKCGYTMIPSMNNTHNGIIFSTNLLGYKTDVLQSTKGYLTGNNDPIYGYNYTIYKFSAGFVVFYVIHMHWPANCTETQLIPIYRELKAIAQNYVNVIITGDTNDVGNSYHNPSGNKYANIEQVFTLDEGWHIANKEVDNTPTLDFNDDGRVNYILDYCIWKGSGIEITDFEVLKDAIIPGSAALAQSEDYSGSIDTSSQPYQDHINYRLSDHWPIKFTVKNTFGNFVPSVEGNTRYNPVTKAHEWFNGNYWVSKNYIELKDQDNLDNIYTPGTYLCNNAAIARTIIGYPLVNDFACSSFTLIVLPIGNLEDWGRRSQLLLNNTNSIIATRISKDLNEQSQRTGYYSWRYIHSHYGYKTRGTTAERPTGVTAGYEYFDTDLNEGKGLPIWYDGNATTGWCDANGTAV